MDKSKINELYKRFDIARSEMDKASRALATALNTDDNCKIISKKTRTVFNKGMNSVKPVDLMDERTVYNLFNILMILDILDGSYEEPAEDVEIYDEEVIEAVELEVVEAYIAPETETVEPEPEPETYTEPEPETYTAPEPVKDTYATQESTYESASSSYDDSSSSYDSGGSDSD